MSKTRRGGYSSLIIMLAATITLTTAFLSALGILGGHAEEGGGASFCLSLASSAAVLPASSDQRTGDC